MRKLLVLLFIVFCCIGIVLGYFYWPKVQKTIQQTERPSQEEEQKDLKTAKELLDQGKPEDAIKIIRKYDNFISMHTQEGKEWIDLLIKASMQVQNIQQLMVLYDYFPEAFNDNEDATLLVLHGFLASGRTKDFDDLRPKWKGREKRRSVWIVMDADRLIVDGKKTEAEQLLNSETFTGPEDTNRLLRLAWIVVNENPQKAWDYLAQAYDKDPNNPFIRVYRARLLEAGGKNSLALSEYIAAVQAAPNSLPLRDQLAEFFRRYNQYPQAIEVWLGTLKAPDSEYLWLKAWFWSRVITPVKIEWKEIAPKQGPVEPLANYLLSLKPDQFWNESAFEKIPNNNSILRDQQLTFWLRIIQTLKDGKEKEAIELLQYNPFRKSSWSWHLETALQRVLQYRKTGSLKVEELPGNKPDTSKSKDIAYAPDNVLIPPPQFYAEMEEIANKTTEDGKPAPIPDNMKALLDSDEAFAAIFLASGWWETALALNKTQIVPDNLPDWVAYGLTQALRLNRSNEEALQFATKQKQTQILSLLEAELLIATGSPDAALEKLEPLSKEDNNLGIRASWIMSLIYLDKKEYAKSRELINLHPALAEGVVGKETLARIALLEGNPQLADSLYTSLEKDSAEAKSYLARKAFADKNWKRAKELTEELMLQYPTNPLIRQNFQKIIEEEQKEKQGLSNPIPSKIQLNDTSKKETSQPTGAGK